MTALGFHSCTGMAVKSVVSHIKNILATKFDFLEGMPAFFYDFDKGVSPQFLQYYAKISPTAKEKPWIVLSYSYDSPERSNVQPRNGIQYRRDITPILKRDLDVTYTKLPVAFSILTNDSKALNALGIVISTKIEKSFSCYFQDLLWPTWVSNHQIPLGWYIRPSVPNNYLYMCAQEGTSGTTEPTWPAVKDATISDNTTTWKCVEPEMMVVRAEAVVQNPVIIQNPIESGIMYQFDFGMTLHYADFDDAGTLTGVVTKVELDLLERYNSQTYEESIIVE